MHNKLLSTKVVEKVVEYKKISTKIVEKNIKNIIKLKINIYVDKDNNLYD